jgi:hypothetical protein
MISERAAATEFNIGMQLADPDDLQEIGRLLPDLAGPHFSERFPERTVVEFCRWKYFANPIGDAIVGVATDGKRVASLVAGVPKRVQVHSETLLAFELGDFITHPQYRKRGLFSSLIELVCDEATRRGGAFAYVRPNPSSFRLLVPGLSFLEVQKIDERRYVVPSGAIHRKAGITPQVPRALGVDWLTRRLMLPRAFGSTTIEPVTRFGSEMDNFWERTREHYSFVLVKDSRYLNWRYADCPTPYQLWIAHRKGQVTGYLTQFLNRAEQSGYLVDLFTDPSDLETAGALLRVSMNQMLQKGTHSVHAWTLQSGADQASTQVLKRTCWAASSPQLHVAMRFLGARLSDSGSLPANGWQLALGDFDGI